MKSGLTSGIVLISGLASGLAAGESFFPLPDVTTTGNYCWRCQGQTYKKGTACITFKSLEEKSYPSAKECCDDVKGAAADCVIKSDKMTYTREDAMGYTIDLKEADIGYTFVKGGEKMQYVLAEDSKVKKDSVNFCMSVVGVHKTVSSSMCQKACRKFYSKSSPKTSEEIQRFITADSLEGLCMQEGDLYKFNNVITTKNEANSKYKCFSSDAYGYDSSDGGSENRIGFFKEVAFAAQCKVFAEQLQGAVVIQYNAQAKTCLVKNAKQIRTLLQMTLEDGNADVSYCHTSFNAAYCKMRNCYKCKGKTVCAWPRDILMSGYKLCGKSDFECNKDQTEPKITTPTTPIEHKKQQDTPKTIPIKKEDTPIEEPIVPIHKEEKSIQEIISPNFAKQFQQRDQKDDSHSS